MALLKVLSDRNEHVQQVGILNEDLVRSRRLSTFLDHKLIALLLFGGHLIDWNLSIPTEGAEIRGLLVQCGCPMTVYPFFVISACWSGAGVSNVLSTADVRR
jgi:hypothetical protein